MRNITRSVFGLAVLTTALSLSVFAEEPQPGFVDFGKLVPASSGEFIEVNVGSNLISMVARLAEKKEPDVAELLGGLKLVRVNVVGLTDENRAEMTKRVKAIHEQLAAKHWDRVVTVQKADEEIGVFIKTRGQEAVEGVVVTVVEAKGEVVLINVVGNIKPEKLAELGEKLDIDPLKKVGQALDKKSSTPEQPK